MNSDRPALHDKPPDSSADYSVRLRLARDIADVTWRMFVPSVAGAVAGVIIDRRFGVKPIGTISGVLVGFTVVGFLVWRQIRATQNH